MTTEERQRLKEGYFTDSLSAKKTEKLLRELEADAEFLVEFANELAVHGALREAYSEDATFKRCISGLLRASNGADDDKLADHLIESLATAAVPEVPVRRMHLRRVLYLTIPLWVAALVTLAFVIGNSFERPGVAMGVIAATPKVTLTRGTERVLIDADTVVRAGDRLLVPPGESARLVLEDESIVDFAGGSKASLAAVDGGQTFLLHGGELTAKVETRSPSAPFVIKSKHGEARVIGTGLKVSVDEDHLALKVTRGKVALHGSEHRKRTVRAGQHAIIRDGQSPVLVEPKLLRLVAKRPTPGQLAFSRAPLAAHLYVPWDISPADWNPHDFDANEIVRACADAGIETIIARVSFKSGFCVWPSASAVSTVADTPWRDGKGDFMAELASASREHGLRFGVSYTVFASPATKRLQDGSYTELVVRHFQELLGNYGKVDEVWLYDSGAVRGFDWRRVYDTCRQLAPDAVIGNTGPDVRRLEGLSALKRQWLYGSEEPFEELDWRSSPNLVSPIGAEHLGWRFQAVRIAGAGHWTDYSTPALTSATVGPELQATVGSGHRANIVLFLDDDGTLVNTSEESLAVLARWRQPLTENLAAGARVIASATKRPKRQFSTVNLLDGDYDTIWQAPDWSGSVTLEIQLPEAREVNCLELAAAIQAGDRAARAVVEVNTSAGWLAVGEIGHVGPQAWLRFDEVKTDRLRLRLEDARVAPALAELALRRLPGRLE